MMPKYGIIVMLDALGASSFDIDQAIEFIKKRDDLLNSLGDVLRSFYGQVTDAPQSSIATFGDTIVISWPTGRENVMRMLPCVAEWLRPAIQWGIAHGILLRGCMSVGEYIEDGATVLGPAIADAAKWYEAADWFGVILSPSCQMRLISLIESAKLDPFMKCITFEQWFIQYPVPFKDGIKNFWVISWPYNLWATDDGKTITPLGVLSTCLWDSPIPRGTESKYENTMAFFNWYGQTIYPKICKIKKKMLKKDLH
jgi:hypothetical protein